MLVQFPLLRAMFVWIAIVTPGVSLRAQTVRDVSLTVQVTDIAGVVIPSAHVTLVRRTTKIWVEAKTDENGCARLSVEPGDYRFFVSSRGFFTWDQQVNIGDAAPQQIEAELRSGCPPGAGLCVTVDPAQKWLNELMPISPPMDSVRVEEQ